MRIQCAVLCMPVVLLLTVTAQDGMTAIGTAVEAFSPCTTRILNMNREIGGPPASENYWDGTITLKNYTNVPEVRVSLRLDNPAKVELDPNDGRVLVSNNTFHLSYFKAPPQIDQMKFVVRGRPFGRFPNVLSLKLNEADICGGDPAKWQPSIIGLSNTGDSDGGDSGSDNGMEPAETCGIRKIVHESLITSGYETRPGDFPWHAAIFHREPRSLAYKCGGTIIDVTRIVTAGHCVYDSSGRPIVPERMTVQLGRHGLYTADANTQEYQVFQIRLHPDYRETTLANDIAILKLANPIAFTNHIQPVCLWQNARVSLQHVEHKRGTVTGWGYTEFDQVSDTLKAATMPVVSFTECLQSNRDFFGLFLSDKNYCAGYRNGTSVCNGDSGGGMVFEENGVWRLRGIVSLSVKRADKDLCSTSQYVVFTDVAQYLDWISSSS